MKKFFKKLKEHFDGDKEASEALSLLEAKLKANPVESKSKGKSPVGEYPLPQKLAEDHIFLFTDGACRGNPGPGAWGALAQDNKGEILFEASDSDEHTTNNIMELTAVLEGLEFLVEEYSDHSQLTIHVYSDSKYVVEGMKSWVFGWKRRGWKKADNKTPENVQIWQALDQVRDNFADVFFYWVKGHSGHPQNERVDELANIALDTAGF